MAGDSKRPLDSKTIKYNSLWLAIAVAMLSAFIDNQALIQEYVPSWVYLIVIIVNAGMGIFLRCITHNGISR